MQLSFPYRGRRFPAISTVDGILLIAAACVIAFLSLGAHDLAIAHLGIPYPEEGAVPRWAKLIGLSLRIAAAVYFCRLASWYLDRQPAVAAAVLMGAIVVFFHETFRVIVIDNVLVEGWVDHRWVYMIAQRLPGACLNFFWGAAAAMIARRMAGKPILLVAAAVLLVATVGYVVLVPGIAEAGNRVVHAMVLTEPPELYQMPYTLYIYTYIYGGFIEPAIAMFVMVWLAWPGLEGSSTRRIAIMAAITLMMRGRVIATFMYCFWLKLPLATAMAAEGQFFVETLVQVACTGAVWSAVVDRSADR